jgi:hypothetical protein
MYKFLIISCVLSCLAFSEASALEVSEYDKLSRLRAITILKLFPFIEWKASTNNRSLCYLRSDPFTGIMKQLSEDPSYKSLKVTTFHVISSEQLSQCQILYFDNNDLPESLTGKQISFDELHHKGIFTISTYDGFAKAGGLLELAVVNQSGIANNRPVVVQKQLMLANKAAVKKFEKRINPRLLQLLKAVD